jgi:hypothetical protein
MRCRVVFGGCAVLALVASTGHPFQEVPSSRPPSLSSRQPEQQLNLGAKALQHSPRATAIPNAVLQIAFRMLLNISEHGFNPCTDGLYVNWDAHGVNYQGNGIPDPNPCSRHDPLTDLRYLHALLLYRHDTKSTYFDADITKFTTIVLHEFGPVAYHQGWVYDEFVDMAKLTGNRRFAAIARGIVDAYVTKLPPTSRPDYGFEDASALVQSGVPRFVKIGRARINALFDTWFDEKLDLIYTPPELVTSSEADIAIALVRAGYRADASLVLKGLHRMWDPIHGGYTEGIRVNDDGSLTLHTKKTGGRMANIYELAVLLGDRPLENEMRKLIFDHIYIPALQGVVYEQHEDWTLYEVGDGVVNDWVTTEAMGIVLTALLAGPGDEA